MEQLASTAKGLLESFGKTFLMVGYFPALLFVLAHQWIIFPVWLGRPLTIFLPPPDTTAKTTNDLVNRLPTIISTELTTLVFPVLVGIVLITMNNIIIRLYEGRFWILQHVLLRPLYQRNVARCRELYGDIVKLKKRYRLKLATLHRAGSPAEQLATQQKLDAMACEMDKTFRNIENKVPQQALPMDEYRITSTALGNVYAIAEEYPFDRYGIDAVLFWPRLRPLLDKADAAHVERLMNQKTVLDMTLSLSLLSGVFVLESLLTLMLHRSDQVLYLVAAAIISMALYWLFYQAGISATSTFGQLIVTSFDFHRHLVLKQFGLKVPEDLQAEQVVWLNLAAFLRRGEAYYWERAMDTKTEHTDECKDDTAPTTSL